MSQQSIIRVEFENGQTPTTIDYDESILNDRAFLTD